MNEIFKKRFVELADAHTKFPYEHSGMGTWFCRSGKWEGWATSSENLIRAVFGEEAPHYKNFRAAYSNCLGGKSDVEKLIAIFSSAKEDFEGGIRIQRRTPNFWRGVR